MTRDSLRQTYGMVLQDTWLKAGHHRGRTSPMASPMPPGRRSIAAAKAAHAHSFIKPDAQGL